MPGYLAGRAPRNKGMQYPPDPPRAEEIVLVMRQAGRDQHGLRVRALIAVLWRGGLRISALALNETDIDEGRGSLLVRHGRCDKRREAVMDQFGFEQLAAWLAHRVSLPPGPLFCVIDGPTRGRRWSATAARAELRQLAVDAGVRRRFAPHQLRHAHAVELAREGVAINIIQRQLGHTDLGTTSTYLQGIDPSEIIDAVRSRHQPTISATAGTHALARTSIGCPRPRTDGRPGAEGTAAALIATPANAAAGASPLPRRKPALWSTLGRHRSPGVDLGLCQSQGRLRVVGRFG